MDEEDECADAGEVGRPRHHHQQDRRHVVDEHLPAKEEIETVLHMTTALRKLKSSTGLGYIISPLVA